MRVGMRTGFYGSPGFPETFSRKPFMQFADHDELRKIYPLPFWLKFVRCVVSCALLDPTPLRLASSVSLGSVLLFRGSALATTWAARRRRRRFVCAQAAYSSETGVSAVASPRWREEGDLEAGHPSRGIQRLPPSPTQLSRGEGHRRSATPPKVA